MNLYSRFRLENQILIKCSIRWPYSEHKPLSFQKSIGNIVRPENRSTAEVPAFPISMLRRDKEATAFFEAHITELKAHVSDSRCIDVDYDLSNVTERKMLPERVFGCRIGSFDIEDMDDLKGKVTEIVDYAWTSWQAFYMENIQTKFQTGGLAGSDLHDLYRQYWYDKDGTMSERSQIDTHLFSEYRNLARQRLRVGDINNAAQYSQICLNLAKNLFEIEQEVFEEFGRFAEKWNQLTAQEENSVKKQATVAREGIAEFWRIEMAKLGGEKKIIAVDANYQNSLLNLNYKQERTELLSKSVSNPYRAGFETVEQARNGFGSVILSMWGILTEWPLEELRLRVPASAVAQLQKDSVLAPNLRASKLSEIGKAGLFTAPERAVKELNFLFDQLDGSIPGIAKCSLSQLAIEKGK